MKKIKVNENLLALLMFAAMFAGWQYLIIVTAFIWGFCECGNNLKNLTIKVVAVFGSLALVQLGWDLVLQAWDVVAGGLNRLFEALVSWGVDNDLVYNYNKYFTTPLGYFLEIVTSVITFAVLFVKLVFINNVLRNKEMTGVLAPFQKIANRIMLFAKNNFYEDDKASKDTAKTKFCPNCGQKCDEETTFCTSCGNKF